jgi:dolichol-phosphate mannosyltransferase
MAELSAVIPVYGCKDCLSALHRRLTAALGGVTDDWEIVYVDDCSPDESWPVLLELALDPRVRALHLSRNFGQSAAITAGLAHCDGDWVVVMDCDLQDPPEAIPKLFAKAQEGNEIVFTIRGRRDYGVLRRVGTAAYLKLRDAVADEELRARYSGLSLISRRVVQAFLSVGDRNSSYLMILRWLGFRHAAIEVRRDKRHAGQSAYTPRSLLRLAVTTLGFQTTALLRWVVFIGFAISLLGIVSAVYLALSSLFTDPQPGWSILAVLVTLIGGLLITSTGISALYAGQILDRFKQRPLYVVDMEASSDRGERPLPLEIGGTVRR